MKTATLIFFSSRDLASVEVHYWRKKQFDRVDKVENIEAMIDRVLGPMHLHLFQKGEMRFIVTVKTAKKVINYLRGRKVKIVRLSR